MSKNLKEYVCNKVLEKLEECELLKLDNELLKLKVEDLESQLRLYKMYSIDRQYNDYHYDSDHSQTRIYSEKLAFNTDHY